MKIANKEYGKFLNEIKLRIIAARIKTGTTRASFAMGTQRMKKSICILIIINSLFGFLIWDFGFADEYRLAPADQLEIKIIGQKDLDTKQSIAPDGTISLPLLGRMTVQGQTLSSFNKDLSDKFSKYIKNPQVVVYLMPRPIYIVQHDLRKNTWEIKEAKSISEAHAYMGVSTSDIGRRTSDIKHGDVVTVDISKKPDFFEDNWYKIITGAAVVTSIYLSLRR